MPDAPSPTPVPRRWPRGQKFELTEAGLAADAAHREALQGARAAGRSALDGALAGWAGPLGVSPGDGVVLGELRGGKLGLGDLAERLEAAGIDAAAVKGAVDRLVVAGLVRPVPLASQATAAPAPPNRWR